MEHALNRTARGPRGAARGARAPIAKRHHGEAAPRTNIYDEITQRIIAQLEAGTVPWVRPWTKVAVGQPGLPLNVTTGRAYSGINILLLWGAVIAADYPSQGWLTFRQALDAGGSVRKGEKGTGIVYADRFVPEAERARAVESGAEARFVPFLKRFTVFNVAQCDGLPERLTAAPPPAAPQALVPVAEQVIAASRVAFRIGGDRAFYAPVPDIVQVPPQSAFPEALDYYRIALHELTHATGHAARLDRDQTGAFGSKDYAREELVAEMGSAFLCAALGIVPTLRHAEYLASWLAVLREDNRAVVRAASAASRAADWLLSQPGAVAMPGAETIGEAA